ncbi:MAG: DUF4038 domain-containing protein [Acidobacteria bacterium]|nr:DUF4038 domain-containing protein [Acidobacteriota bacterium]
MRIERWGLGLLLALAVAASADPRLKVSDDRRSLVRENGEPFFYLGDTVWELFHRYGREDVVRYLDDRASKGFTVIQAVALAEFDGLHAPNPYGFTPLIDDDPTRPDVRPGPENDYWDHVDFAVDAANQRGLTVGFLPSWGDKWNILRGVGPEIFTPQNAEAYGEWLGTRYRDKDLIWILGGDRTIDEDDDAAIIRAMARGLRRGDGGAHLMTFHPRGGHSSSENFHDDEWLDFNMRQNGHNASFTEAYARTIEDYRRTPTKPVIDGEPIYEDHPVSFRAQENGHSVAADVRRPLYWDLFSGAFGHTYGHHSIWQMWQPGRKPVNYPLLPWFEALDAPGAGQMQYGRRLLESRPLAGRIPDDAVIVPDEVATAVPGAGKYRLKATRDAGGAWAMVYTPSGRPFTVDFGKLSGEEVRAWWFNPRDGAAQQIGVFPRQGQRRFFPPAPGEMLDWVLVLDDVSKGYPPPGSRPVR